MNNNQRIWTTAYELALTANTRPAELPRHIAALNPATKDAIIHALARMVIPDLTQTLQQRRRRINIRDGLRAAEHAVNARAWHDYQHGDRNPEVVTRAHAHQAHINNANTHANRTRISTTPHQDTTDWALLERVTAGETPPRPLTRAERREAIRKLNNAGHSANEIADQIGVTPRTIHRTRTATRKAA